MSSRAYKSPRAYQAVMESYSTMLGCWHAQLHERDIETKFGKTHIIESGHDDLPPIVLLHGGGGNSTMWFPNIPVLTQHFKIYAIDIIGEMGKSEDTRMPYESDDYSLWLADVLQALSLKQPHLLGTSLGATLLIKFSIKFPDLVDQLILISPPSLKKMNSGFVFRGLLSALFPNTLITRKFYNYITSSNSAKLQEWALQDQCIRAKAQRININAVPVVSEEQLSKLPKSTLLILGEDDPIYSIESAIAKVNRAAPQIKVSVVKNAGHVTTVEQPELFKEVLFDFMELPTNQPT